jgi:hypothetical protein
LDKTAILAKTLQTTLTRVEKSLPTPGVTVAAGSPSANAQQMRAPAVLVVSRVYVANRPPLSCSNLDSYRLKRWHLTPMGFESMDTLVTNINTTVVRNNGNAAISFLKTKRHDVTCFEALTLNNNSYLGTQVLNAFAFMTTAFKHNDVNQVSDAGDKVPLQGNNATANNHQEALTQREVTLLPCHFHDALAGLQHWGAQPGCEGYNLVPDGEYNHDNVKRFTAQYMDSSYLRRDIVTIVHR